MDRQTWHAGACGGQWRVLTLVFLITSIAGAGEEPITFSEVRHTPGTLEFTPEGILFASKEKKLLYKFSFESGLPLLPIPGLREKRFLPELKVREEIKTKVQKIVLEGNGTGEIVLPRGKPVDVLRVELKRIGGPDQVLWLTNFR